MSLTMKAFGFGAADCDLKRPLYVEFFLPQELIAPFAIQIIWG